MVKNQPAKAKDAVSVAKTGMIPGGGNGNPFQYSCKENSMNRGAGVTELDTTQHICTHASNVIFTMPHIQSKFIGYTKKTFKIRRKPGKLE